MGVSYSGRSWQEANEFIEAGRNVDYRKFTSTRKLHRLFNGSLDIAFRLHDTDIIIYHPDGFCTITMGGWNTHLTRMDLNNHTPARVSSNAGTPCVYHKTDPLTSPRVQKCRVCHGTGEDFNVCGPYQGRPWHVDQATEAEWAAIPGITHAYFDFNLGWVAKGGTDTLPENRAFRSGTADRYYGDVVTDEIRVHRRQYGAFQICHHGLLEPYHFGIRRCPDPPRRSRGDARRPGRHSPS